MISTERSCDSMSMWDHAGEWYLEHSGRKAEPGLGEILLPMRWSRPQIT